MAVGKDQTPSESANKVKNNIFSDLLFLSTVRNLNITYTTK